MHAKNWREKIAIRSAALMCAPSGFGYDKARQEAIRLLGCGAIAPSQLPTKKEIREKIGLLSGHQQTLLRRCLLDQFLAAMQHFETESPQVDAAWLTAEILPDTQYVIQIRGEAEHKASATVPVETDGIFLLVVRRSSAGDAIFNRPHLGIAELRTEIERLDLALEASVPATTSVPADRFAHFAALLFPLEVVMLSPTRHPEGDALYHSLQVFQQGQQFRDYDEEFLLAALLHDVGKGIDPENHVVAGLAALETHISQRTADLIELHHEAHRYRDGTLGMRARRRLELHPDFEDLLLLAECDVNGRVCGVRVPEVEQALEQIRELSEKCAEFD